MGRSFGNWYEMSGAWGGIVPPYNPDTDIFKLGPDIFKLDPDIFKLDPDKITNIEVLDTSHYDRFEYKLTKKDIEQGSIRIDPYFVSSVWKLGARDKTGGLSHILKTLARTKEGNSIVRELESIKATIIRVIEVVTNV